MTSFVSNPTESLLSLGPLRSSIVLPQEILIQIFSYQLSQSTLHACTLVSTCWYTAAVKPLYTNPRILGKNFEPFTNTVCPSINSHIRTNGLAGFIKRLDLSLLVHHGSKSLTARLLGRVKGNLEEFVAPQTSFAVNSLVILSKCYKLRHLNLSFISESLDMPRFFKMLGNLCNLEVLHFPRTSCHSSSEVNSLIWPPRLRELHMIGNLDYSGLPPLNNFPPSLTYLSLRKCRLEMPFIYAIIENLGPQLLQFRYGHDMVNMYEGHLEGILKKIPSVQRLSIPLQQISARFFSYPFELDSFTPTQIVELELTSNVHVTDENHDINSGVIWDAVLNGGLGRLRILKIHQELGWPRSDEESTDLQLLSEMLQALAREDGEHAIVSEEKAGVYIFS